jgi:hypothetical protein
MSVFGFLFGDMGKARTTTTKIRDVENISMNECASVVCSNTQITSFDLEEGAEIDGLHLKQSCSAKTKCIMDTLMKDAANDIMKSNAEAGSLGTGSTDTYTTILNRIKTKVENKCGSAASSQTQITTAHLGKNAKAKNILFEQVGAVTIDCVINTVASATGSTAVESSSKTKGLFGFIDDIVSPKNLIIIGAVVAVIGVTFIVVRY